MNVLTITGNIGSIRGPSTRGETVVLNFTVAVRKGRDETEWFDAAVWGDRATALAPHVIVGETITVSGPVSAEVYDGKARMRLIAREITLSRRSAAASDRTHPAPSSEAAPQAQAEPDDFEDDIPF